MKCPICNGGGRIKSLPSGMPVKCIRCNGTGEVEQTNEEWLRMASTEQLAEEVYKRIDYFHDFNSITYGYNKSFKQIDDTLYYSNIYNSQNFNIFRILINNNIIHRMNNVNELKNNTYTINEDGLYIRTTLPIQKIKIKHSINGLLFNNHKTSFHEHIINMSISNVKMLSELENNSVERISFNLNILYHMLRKRKFGPILEDVKVSSDKNGN